MKYTFSPGEDIPAESFQTLDPDNPVAQTPAKLIGGTDVTSSNFITLGAGANDGAFKINIDGVEYDNVGIDLSESKISISQEIGNSDAYFHNSQVRQGQSFFWEGGTLTKIDLTLSKRNTPTGEYTLNLYEADENDFPTGSVIKSVSKLSQDLTTSYADYSFDFNVLLVGNKKYVLVLSFTGVSLTDGKLNCIQWAYTDSNVYSGGISIVSTDGGSTWNAQNTYDKRFIIYSGIISGDGEEIASVIQTAIRARTGKSETVIWDTDHFEITSSISGKTTSSILKLTAPTTGTDISGAGYLDLGENATEVAGDGDDYKLVRLDKDGKIPQLPTHTGDNQVVSGKSLNSVYQNTSVVPRIIIVSAYHNAGIGGTNCRLTGKIGTTNTPDKTCAITGNDTSGNSYNIYTSITFIVPAGYYYTVSGVGSTIVLTNWFECDLI
ncbi:MAG: hypothetical protein GX309_06775 [Clostridiales bacterium]|nr:hypothetical protein [Clostridiales bacterium]